VRRCGFFDSKWNPFHRRASWPPKEVSRAARRASEQRSDEFHLRRQPRARGRKQLSLRGKRHFSPFAWLLRRKPPPNLMPANWDKIVERLK